MHRVPPWDEYRKMEQLFSGPDVWGHGVEILPTEVQQSRQVEMQ